MTLRVALRCARNDARNGFKTWILAYAGMTEVGEEGNSEMPAYAGMTCLLEFPGLVPGEGCGTRVGAEYHFSCGPTLSPD